MRPSEIQQLNRAINKTQINSDDELSKIIRFYKTVLELERIKEPEIENYYPYEIHFKENDSNVILIDLPCNSDYTKVYFENKCQTFQKDLFVGLPVVCNGNPQPFIAFSLTVNHDALNGYAPYENLLPIRISDLTFDNRHIDQLQLTREQIEAIEGELGKVKNIDSLQALVKKHFGQDFDLKMELQLGLSSKNIALSQISAEMDRLSSHWIERNQLLKSFLTHSEFDNAIKGITENDLIRVSSLDDSQASVVVHALSNRFSVVTGAPGTGKTQVILNLIANALLYDKSVLVASKNNKAVDNVKERFDIIDPSQYLVRFGRKEYVRSQTVPALENIINRIGSLDDEPNSLTELLCQHNNIVSSIKTEEKKLSRITELNSLLPNLKSKISSIQSQIANENQQYEQHSRDIKNRYSEVLLLENVSYDCIKRITEFKNYLKSKYSGRWKWWHNIFNKKKHAETYLRYVCELPSYIWPELSKRELTYSYDTFKNGDAIIEEAEKVLALIIKIYNWHRERDNEDSRHSKAISTLNSDFQTNDSKFKVLSNELATLNFQRSAIINSISTLKTTQIALGEQIIAAKIIEIEKGQGAAGKISGYKNYLPDNIPWQRDLIAPFISRSRDFLSVCRLVSVTSLSVKASLPLTDNLFDILIIDEASQCDIASALPLILRAKQVVVIGDPNQLKHITSVKRVEEDYIRDNIGLSARPYLKYAEQSLWDYSREFLTKAHQNSATITLWNHYRCHPDIIGYSNQQFYERTLQRPLNIMTDVSKMTLQQKGIVMIPIKGKQEAGNININRIEAQRAASLAKEIHSLNAGVSVGIVTPFRKQADYINSLLDDYLKGQIEVNTAHGFQGDEKDVMIYSLVITDNSPASKVKWIDTVVPNLVNVAVTRARQTLYVIGNAEYLKSVSPEQNPLGRLIRYAESKTK